MWFIKFLQSFSNPFLDKFFTNITILGDDKFFIIIFALILWCINKDFGYRIGFTFYTNSMWNAILKDIFQIPRQFGQMDIRTLNDVPVGGYSFPSGHVQYASSYLTSIMLRLKNSIIFVIGFILILLVSFSRMYLGAHTPIDVIGGALVGIGWVFLSNWIFDLITIGGKVNKLIIAVLIILGGMLFNSSERYFISSGVTISILITCYLDNKYINFTIPRSKMLRCAMFLVGISTYKWIDGLVTPLFTKSPVQCFLNGFFSGTLIAFIIPGMFYLISKIKFGKLTKSNSEFTAN